MNKISVVVITKNEEENIKDCLESVMWASEIIVVDSGSDDKTISIAKQFTDKVIFNKWTGFAEQKNFAINQATNEWILSVDADERVTAKLKDEILKLKLGNYDGYKIKRENYFFGKKIRGCGWGNDYQLRLFNKSKTRLSNRLVHEGFEVAGKINYLKNPMLHFSYRNFHDAFNKINHYSTLEAIEKKDRKSVNFLSIVITPILAFFQHYIIRYGFIDGIYGLFVSILHAYTKLQVQLKIWELKNK
jgi:glycosyltransferase involved in cell wall biosynthesis